MEVEGKKDVGSAVAPVSSVKMLTGNNGSLQIDLNGGESNDQNPQLITQNLPSHKPKSPVNWAAPHQAQISSNNSGLSHSRSSPHLTDMGHPSGPHNQNLQSSFASPGMNLPFLGPAPKPISPTPNSVTAHTPARRHPASTLPTTCCQQTDPARPSTTGGAPPPPSGQSANNSEFSLTFETILYSPMSVLSPDWMLDSADSESEFPRSSVMDFRDFRLINADLLFE
ncbi:RNA-binding (RRM/RBD/RNP motifs) family protein [Striga asiatica]|uniref:RNA-binding (RRM/RBD/RNP motifs) family protein n=1 Tax=Striga asiatica TaxID=4170 RepID=A0A5A7QKQ5_STRAF|nr:RNA-binding (RRM/RBD/RNP motifs) family protein [Striga asiatica]